MPKKRSTMDKFTDSKHLNEVSVRNKKRERLVGKKRVAQQNRDAFLAPTEKAATKATIARVGEYKRAKKKSQFAQAGKAKQHKTDF